MNIEMIGGAEIAMECVESMEPILDLAPANNDFAMGLVRRGHFVFSVDGDPMKSPWRMTGMACPKKAIVSRARAGTIIYACKDGASHTINASAAETCVSARLEYVRAVDIVAFGQEVGIEQWGIVRIGKDADELLADWPGAIAKEISIPWAEAKTLSFEAKHQIDEWYEWATETLLVQRGFVK